MLAIVPFMYCDAPSAVVSIRKAVDATHAGAGHVTLADGASFDVTKPDDDSFVVRLHESDPVTLCYAPPQRFADAGPTARMAIAGNTRTGDYLYALAHPAKNTATSASAGLPFAVLVPLEFDGVALHPAARGVTVVDTHGSDRYRIEVDLAPDCHGANVCSVGAFSGYGPAAIVHGRVIDAPDGDLYAQNSPRPSEHAVRLADGTMAFYKERISGASDGGNSSLRWLRNGVLYVIESRISTPAKLVATANSAIANHTLDGTTTK